MQYRVSVYLSHLTDACLEISVLSSFRRRVCSAGDQSGWSWRKVFSAYLPPGK